MDVSIIIVSCNERDFLRRCLTSIYDHTREIEFEVIVVDNASQDGAPDMVMADFSQVTLVRRSSNTGFACAVNQGISVGRGGALLVLNPDAEFTSNVLPPMLAYLREHPEIGILAPKLLDADGSLQLSCRAFPGFSTALFNRYSLLTRFFRNNRLSKRYLMTDFDHSTIADVDWASAACWLLPRPVYEKIGPLDEGYFWSIEDVDYCQRAHRAGLRVVYFPEVTVRHHIGGSAATHRNRIITERHRSMWRYYRTYLRPDAVVARRVVDGLVWIGILLRYVAQLASHNLRRAIALGRR
jgi:GT2 family glycosyltransferase